MQNFRKQIFLLDGIGALVSFLLLYFLILSFQPWFGMPTQIVRSFAFAALLFCFYSLSCHFLRPSPLYPYLFGISFMNVVYCLVSILCVFSYWSELTLFGVLYFSGEKIIVFSLAAFEAKTAWRYKSQG